MFVKSDLVWQLVWQRKGSPEGAFVQCLAPSPFGAARGRAWAITDMD